MYVNEYKKIYPNADDAAVDRQIEADFPKWFRDNASAIQNRYPNGHHLYYLAMGPLRKAKAWPIIFVNGYKFHTLDRGQRKRTYNSGVCVSGIGQGPGANDFYGQVTEILAIEWPGKDVRRCVLFNCEWFDPSSRGTRIHQKYGIVEVKKNRHYSKYDPFIFASTAIQVYYCPYPARVAQKADWWVVIKTKPRSAVEGRKEMEVALQSDEVRSTARIEDDIVVDLRDSSDDGEEIFLNTTTDFHQQLEDIDEEVEDDTDEADTAEDDDEDDDDDVDTAEDDDSLE